MLKEEPINNKSMLTTAGLEEGELRRTAKGGARGRSDKDFASLSDSPAQKDRAGVESRLPIGSSAGPWTFYKGQLQRAGSARAWSWSGWQCLTPPCPQRQPALDRKTYRLMTD